MAFTQSTVTHQFTNADGTPASGSVTATLTKRVTNGTQTIVPAEITANLDASGHLSVLLYSNVDTGTNPTDSEWRIEFRILGAASETFFITVPVGPGSVDLGGLLPQNPLGGQVSNEVSPQWQTYLDLANDVKPWLQIPATDTASDTKLQLVLDMACWWAQNDHLHQPIAPTTFFRRFSGYSGFNGAHISLPYYPVLSVTSVVETWGTSGQHTLTEQTPTNQGGTNMYTLDPLHGILTRSFAGLIARPWFPGLRNVEVTWVAGCNPIPPTYRLGTLELVKYWWANTQQASRSFRTSSEYDEPQGQHDLWPAVPNRIASMFQAGQQIGMG